MQLILRAYDLKLKHTFTISRQSFDTKPTLIVELKDDNISGFGEASSNPYYKITIEKMMEDLSKYKDIIENSKEVTPEEFWQKMYPYFKSNMFALCALDLAYNDLYARKKNKKSGRMCRVNLSRCKKQIKTHKRTDWKKTIYTRWSRVKCCCTVGN